MEVKSEVMSVEDYELTESIMKVIKELNNNIKILNKNIEAQQLLKMFEVNNKNGKGSNI